jgi:hypothetical protein
VRTLLLLAAGLVLLAGPLPTIPWPVSIVTAPAAATAAVYVYEKDQTAVPTGVVVGLNRLNRDRGIVATLLEADTVDGMGEIPEQYRPALAAAKDRGLPALVVLSGSTVLSVVQAPADSDAVTGAVK